MEKKFANNNQNKNMQNNLEIELMALQSKKNVVECIALILKIKLTVSETKWQGTLSQWKFNQKRNFAINSAANSNEKYLKYLPIMFQITINEKHACFYKKSMKMFLIFHSKILIWNLSIILILLEKI